MNNKSSRIWFFMWAIIICCAEILVNYEHVIAVGNPVTLDAPVEGYSSSDGLWPTLQWSAGTGMSTANGYRIQVSRVANFATTVVDECTRSASYTPADKWWAQTQMGTFYWRINYVNQSWSTQSACKRQTVDSGLWSSVRTYINPVVEKRLTAVNPADGSSTSDGLWPTLEWNPASGDFGGFGYRIQVSKAANFATLIVDECTTATTYRPMSDVWARSQTGTYYWRVTYATSAWSGSSSLSCKSQYLVPSLWGSARSFINPQLRNVVTLDAPVEGYSSSDGLWPTLQWSAGTGMSTTNGYRIQVSKVANFATTVVDECTRSASYTPADKWWAQTQMGTFYWRINYVNQSWSTQSACKRQTVDSGLWSSVRTYINPVVEKRPTAVNPANGSSTSDGLWPTLEWSPASGDFGGFGYRIQVSKAANFATLIVDECTTATTYRPMSDVWARSQTGTYYWRVTYATSAWSGSSSLSCKSQYLVPSLWGSARSFVNVTPQNKVALTSPSDGYTSSDGIWPTLQWSAGSDMSYYYPNGYYIEVSRNSSFTDLIVAQCTTTTSYKPADNSWMQTFRGRLYWRVSYVPRAWNGNQNTCKSQSFSSSLRSETRYFDNP
jgi:hypothetical protein